MKKWASERNRRISSRSEVIWPLAPGPQEDAKDSTNLQACFGRAPFLASPSSRSASAGTTFQGK